MALTIAELITATEAKIAQNVAQRDLLKTAIDTRMQQLADNETRAALLKTRLETLRALAAEEA